MCGSVISCASQVIDSGRHSIEQGAECQLDARGTRDMGEQTLGIAERMRGMSEICRI